ncbi:glycosyltransferase family 2 protein [Cyanobium sp. BA5m-10]|uniref:glycosyltransferase family 2 protein n=1 Tax=Cyanobium sp. BA5m-10 TaxID=2823705 RepID=UPI0020CD8834|nr:glycosyltransferase family 2 protein [Cyanobium sp. BA5m-10]
MTPAIQPNLVSTIIPVYNRPEMVRKAVASVLAQTHRPIEILLVDDGSTDYTPEVLAELQAAHPEEIRVLRQANGGAGLARETGRQQARGAYIQYLDSDDYLLPNKFSDQVAALEAHPECAIAYGTSSHVHADGRVLEDPSRHTADRIDYLFPLLLVERWWHTHTPLFRRWISDAAGPWPAFRPEDWDLEARMGALNPRLIHCGSFVSVQVDHESDNRVTRGPSLQALRDQGVFLPRLYAAAMLAGVPFESPEWARFSDECFVSARQLHQAGEASLGNRLLHLAELTTSGSGSLIRRYGTLSRAVGPRLGARVAQLLRTGRWAT